MHKKGWFNWLRDFLRRTNSKRWCGWWFKKSERCCKGGFDILNLHCLKRTLVYDWGFQTPDKVARHVLDNTVHTLLVGDMATEFALVSCKIEISLIEWLRTFFIWLVDGSNRKVFICTQLFQENGIQKWKFVLANKRKRTIRLVAK